MVRKGSTHIIVAILFVLALFGWAAPANARVFNEGDVSEYMHVTMNHVYSSADSDAGLLRNIVVGIRATWLFPIGEQPQKKIHHKKPNIHKNYDCRCFDYPTNSVF